MIKEIKNYVNEKGFKVEELLPFEENDKSKPKYIGKTLIMFQLPNGQQFPQDVSFEFPEKITSIQDAFENFETYIRQEIERQEQEATKLMAEERKKIIIPGQENQKILQFPGKI